MKLKRQRFYRLRKIQEIYEHPRFCKNPKCGKFLGKRSQHQYCSRKCQKPPFKGHHKRSHLSIFPYKALLMKSTWEVAFARYLDEQMMQWKYEWKTYDLGAGTYTPDFFIFKNDILKEIVEIKGYETEEFKKKYKKFQEMHPNAASITQILKKEELLDIGVLDARRSRSTSLS